MHIADRKSEFLEAQRDHKTITAACHATGYARSTVQRWRATDDDFRRLHDAVLAGRATKLPDKVPVSITEFVCGERYLNKGDTIRPVVMQALREIYDGDDEPIVILCTGAIGTGKSFLQAICFCFEIYRYSTLENPHRAFGLDKDSALVFVAQNRTSALALSNNFALIKSMLLGSRYFRKCYPPIKRPTQNRMVFPNRVEVWGESGDPRSILGTNVACWLGDEMDFMDRSEQSTRAVDGGVFDQADLMFNNARSRQRSRFYLDGKVRAKLLVASSAHYAGAFTESLEREAQHDPEIYCWSHSIWSALPERYSQKMIQIFTGDESREAFILGDDDEIHPRDRSLILNAPVDFEKSARRDLTKFLMNDAGIRVKPASTFFTNRDTLAKAFRHDSIFSRESVVSGGEILVDPKLIVRPEAPRFVHLDLSRSRDSTGVCIGHLAGFVELDRGNDKELLPSIHIDAALAIKPPRHGEINLAWVRSLIYGLRRVLNIVRITADSYQSTDTLQQFAAKGYAVSLLSVDRDMRAYETLKDALLDGRIALPRSSILHKEASQVQLDLRKGKIDHPPRGSKDVLDACAAVAYALTKDPIQRIEHGATARLAPRLGSVVTPIPRPPTGLEPYMAENDPFLRAFAD